MVEHWQEVSSPGLGTTEAPLSVEPLATEGEATPGPDDWNPFDEEELQIALEQKLVGNSSDINKQDLAHDRDPTAGDDPYVFDDVEPQVRSDDDSSLFALPSLDLPESGPEF